MLGGARIVPDSDKTSVEGVLDSRNKIIMWA